MNSPTTALAWEVWQKHRGRLYTMLAILLAFILLYPNLCALAGINIGGQDLFDQIANKLSHSVDNAMSAEKIILALFWLFILCGPKLALCLSLLYVMWMFTTAELDPKTRQLMTFAPRLFHYPVSTSFLYWWFVLAGQAAVIAVYSAWTYLFRQPVLDLFAAYQNCLLWMTMLIVAQAIVWALASWPATAMIVLVSLMMASLISPAVSGVWRSVPVLSGLYVLGLILARVGLDKARHGQWQGLNWSKMIAAILPAKEMSGPPRFTSAARSQLWFEWRRSGRAFCIVAGVISIGSIAVHLALRFSFGWGPLSNETTSAFAGCLMLLPLFLHFISGVSPRQNDMSFILNRPAQTGQFVMAKLKADAISTLVMWALTLVALGGLTLLGDLSQIQKDWHILTVGWPLFILALAFVTWRTSVVNLCFTWSGKPRLIQAPVLMFIVVYVGVVALLILYKYPDHWNLFRRLLPEIGRASCRERV